MPLVRFIRPNQAFWYDDAAEQDDLMSWMLSLRWYEPTAERDGGVTFYLGGGEYTTVYPTSVWVLPGGHPPTMTDADFKATTGPFPEWPTA